MPKACKRVPQSDSPMDEHFSGALVNFPSQTEVKWAKNWKGSYLCSTKRDGNVFWQIGADMFLFILKKSGIQKESFHWKHFQWPHLWQYPNDTCTSWVLLVSAVLVIDPLQLLTHCRPGILNRHVSLFICSAYSSGVVMIMTAKLYPLRAQNSTTQRWFFTIQKKVLMYSEHTWCPLRRHHHKESPF